MMTVDFAKNMINSIALDRHMYEFDWDSNDVFTDGEIEYQVRSYCNGRDFSSILVRFCDDDTHTYREFFEYNYTDDNWYDLFYDAFEDEVVEQLCERAMAKAKRKAGLAD